MLDADTSDDKLAVVHEQAEPALADVNCRLYAVGRQLQELGMIRGQLPPAPYGCRVS